MESEHEEHEGSIWPAVIGINVLVLVAGVVLFLKGISVSLGLGLIAVFIISLVVFVSREVRNWPHVIAMFFARLKGTAIPAEPEKV